LASLNNGGKIVNKENMPLRCVTIVKPGVANENESLLFSSSHHSRQVLHSIGPVNGVPSEVVLR
jgi:hypothetical protein